MYEDEEIDDGLVEKDGQVNRWVSKQKQRMVNGKFFGESGL